MSLGSAESRNSGKRALLLLYPLLFAPLRVLYTAAKNGPWAYSLRDLLALLGLLLAGTGVLYILLFVLLRKWWPAQSIALLLLAGTVWFWGYRFAVGRLMHGLGTVATGSMHQLILGVGGATMIGVLSWLRHSRRVLDRATTFFALSGTLLVAWSGLGVAWAQVHNWRALRVFEASAFARELERPIAVAATPSRAAGSPRRDIYLIVLDSYGNSKALRELYGFDNRAFEDSLRTLGFTIPQAVRSNYSHTTLSLPSLLNFCHLGFLNGLANTSLPHHLVSHNRTVATLKAQGYRFVFFPSQWWVATQRNSEADATFRGWERWSLDRVLTSSPLRLKLRTTTLFWFTDLGGPNAYAEYLRRTFEGLRRVPVSARPTFVFAHVLSPHDPFVLDRTCSPKRRAATNSEIREGYLDQVQCVNRLVLGFARDLLTRSRIPPIILLEGDHGPNAPSFLDEPLDLRSPTRVRGRFGAFGAYYLPDGGNRLFSDSVTLINVLPKIFNHYFGANLTMRPDSLYNWVMGSDSLQPIGPRLLDEGVVDSTVRR